jgi:acyl carrier protein
MFDLQQKILAIVADLAARPEPELQPSHRFKEDLGMDSLAHIDMVMALEAEFKLVISQDDGAAIRTVQDAITFIHGRTVQAISGGSWCQAPARS